MRMSNSGCSRMREGGSRMRDVGNRMVESIIIGKVHIREGRSGDTGNVKQKWVKL